MSPGFASLLSTGLLPHAALAVGRSNCLLKSSQIWSIAQGGQFRTLLGGKENQGMGQKGAAEEKLED